MLYDVVHVMTQDDVLMPSTKTPSEKFRVWVRVGCEKQPGVPPDLAGLSSTD